MGNSLFQWMKRNIGRYCEVTWFLVLLNTVGGGGGEILDLEVKWYGYEIVTICIRIDILCCITI